MNDHHALGVIDVFAKNLKRVLSKEFLENNKARWIDILPKIIEQYNSTPHTALDNITPNQAISDPKKREHVMHLNILKAHDNGFVTDLTPGDKVRIDDTALFKKGTESRWSDEVHVVKEASGKTVTLTDGTTHRRSKILMVPHNTVITPSTEKNVIKVATKQHKDKQLYKRENIKETDVITEGRSSRAGRGVNKYDKHLDQNLKNEPAPEKKTRR